MSHHRTPRREVPISFKPLVVTVFALLGALVLVAMWGMANKPRPGQPLPVSSARQVATTHAQRLHHVRPVRAARQLPYVPEALKRIGITPERVALDCERSAYCRELQHRRPFPVVRGHGCVDECDLVDQPSDLATQDSD